MRVLPLKLEHLLLLIPRFQSQPLLSLRTSTPARDLTTSAHTEDSAAVPLAENNRVAKPKSMTRHNLLHSTGHTTVNQPGLMRQNENLFDGSLSPQK